MAALSRRFLQNPCFLLYSMQRRLVTKVASDQEAKMDKKSKRMESRKEIFKDIRKGYFYDFHEFRKRGGKRFFAFSEPSELKDSQLFPALKARTLSQKEVDLQQEFPGHITLVLLWIKAYGESMCDKYRLPFVQHFHGEPLAQYYEISALDGFFFKTFKGVIEKNLRKERPADRHDNYLFFSGNLKPIKKKIMENEIVGHAYLVDCNGLIRWKAHANPAELEINHMLDCSQLLLKEAKRTPNSEDKVPWNSR